MSSFRIAVGELWGEEVVRRGLATLDPESRLSVEQAAALLWVPIEVQARAIDAWTAAAGVEFEELVDRAVRRSTQRNMSTVLRAFVRFTSDAAIMARAPLLYSKIRNAGKLTTDYRGPGVARAYLTEWQGGTDKQMFSLSISIEALLEVAGRDHARCKFKRTSDGAMFDVTWGDPRVLPRRYR